MSAYLDSLLRAYRPPRMSDLPTALYDRHQIRRGLKTVVVRNDVLPEPSIADLLEFAFMHYAKVGFINAALAEERGWQHEPLSSLKPADKHLMVLDESTCELCAYATLKAPVGTGKRVADEDRPWLSVERAFGRDILAGIPKIQSAAIERVREVGRVTRSAYLDKRDPRQTRASAELLLACVQELLDARNGVEWIAGDGEPDVMIRNVRFLGAAPIVIPNVCGKLPDDHIYQPRYEGRDVLPFAFAVEHIDLERMQAVDTALDQPDALWSGRRNELRNGSGDVKTA